MEVRKDITVTNAEFGFANVYIAGLREMTRHYLSEYVMKGLCVSVVDSDFIYTGGSEAGVCITLINYARFPSNQEDVTSEAISIASFLIERMHQSSASVISPCGSFFISRRDL